MSLYFDIQLLEKVREIISNSKRIVITTHHNPDGDAIGLGVGGFTMHLRLLESIP
jgi:nanoRNase/pAp phosphatase (c-di-AMP/oligoRNAs hydrolase)